MSSVFHEDLNYCCGFCCLGRCSKACCALLVLQMGIKVEEIRPRREEIPLGKIPSRGEWKKKEKLQHTQRVKSLLLNFTSFTFLVLASSSPLVQRSSCNIHICLKKSFTALGSCCLHQLFCSCLFSFKLLFIYFPLSLSLCELSFLLSFESRE